MRRPPVEQRGHLRRRVGAAVSPRYGLRLPVRIGDINTQGSIMPGSAS